MKIGDEHRAIGRVTSIRSDNFVIELYQKINNFTVVGFDDMHYIARIGSFIMIPVQSEYIAAEIIGLWEKDPSANKIEKENPSELNKTLSVKYLEVVPLGVLPKSKGQEFRFGVSVFPSLYTNALYALDDELDRIFKIADSSNNSIEEGSKDSTTTLNALTIGKSSIFEGYDIKVRINDYFGGHAAILGNTGSGKSCTVATILQSLFSKKDEFFARGATFIIFDVNGEYQQAFSNLSKGIKCKYLCIQDEQNTSSDPSTNFMLPHWFMSIEEWEILLQASEKTQRPVLRTALGLSGIMRDTDSEEVNKIKNHILASCLISIFESDDSSPSKSDRIKAILLSLYTSEINIKTFPVAINYGKIVDVEQHINNLNSHIIEDFSLPSYNNIPFSFDSLDYAIHLALCYEEAYGNKQIREFCSQMRTRLKSVEEKEEFDFLKILDNKVGEFGGYKEFIDNFMGLKKENKKLYKESQIIILDMNNVADEAVEVTTAVMARLLFDRLRKADPRNNLPVHLILEEAHRYITNNPSRYSLDAGKIFQRIAKEGRKYGLFLHLASQRPSELSKTVLSQCSNFIVHRIQNPDDLMHIRQMTPFISDSVIKRLPSLPKQHALIFGNAVNIPTTFEVRNAEPRPKSDDADIRKLWFIGDKSEINL